MSGPELNVELERGPWAGDEYADCWPVGGRVTGVLRARFPERVRARKVRVELEWHTQGRGDEDKKVVSSQDVHQGELVAQQEYTWPFTLEVPSNGPITYHGHYLQIVWLVRAVVDIPWARDKKEAQPIQILPDYDADTA